MTDIDPIKEFDRYVETFLKDGRLKPFHEIFKDDGSPEAKFLFQVIIPEMDIFLVGNRRESPDNERLITAIHEYRRGVDFGKIDYFAIQIYIKLMQLERLSKHQESLKLDERSFIFNEFRNNPENLKRSAMSYVFGIIIPQSICNDLGLPNGWKYEFQ